MDKPKTKLIKSKSSNSAITTKSDGQRNKKSRSNAEFQTLMPVKKRGVYVEKNPTKVSLDNKVTDTPKQQNAVKPPPRPRPGQKRFLASVLTILSKTTASTQYPDKKDSIKNDTTKNDTTKNESPPIEKKKKPKFRSKILNSNKHKIETKFEVIQSKKEMTQTPSIYSEASNKEEEFKPWELGLPRLVKPDEEELQGANFSQIVKEVTEGRMLKQKKISIEEPATLVENDNGLYNFFVDLLETTFSVYNLKPEFDACPGPSNKSSKVTFEIDEAVAKKLTVEPTRYEVQEKPPKRFYCFQNDDELLESAKTPSTVRADHPVRQKKKRYKSQSFEMTQRQQYTKGMSQRNSFNKKNNKNDLLNLLKEELEMDLYQYEEPQNLYQALRVMARNKRKTQKSITFDGSAKFGDENSECVFKRRKVISPSTKSSSKYRDEYASQYASQYSSQYATYASQRSSDYGGHSRRRYAKEASSEEEGSNHSLEVYGFDYVYPPSRCGVEKKDGLVLPYHSSDSDLNELEFKMFQDKSDEMVRMETFN